MAKKKLKKFDLVHATNQQLTEVKAEVAQMEAMIKKPDEYMKNKIQRKAELISEIQKRKKFIREFKPKKLSLSIKKWETTFRSIPDIKKINIAYFVFLISQIISDIVNHSRPASG